MKDIYHNHHFFYYLIYIQYIIKQAYSSNCPLAAILTSLEVLPEFEPTASMALTMSIPSKTFPKTTCLPSNHGVGTVVIKNCDPWVFGPKFILNYERYE